MMIDFIVDEEKVVEARTYLENMGCYTEKDIEALLKPPYIRIVIRNMELEKVNLNNVKGENPER